MFIIKNNNFSFKIQIKFYLKWITTTIWPNYKNNWETFAWIDFMNFIRCRRAPIEL